MTAPQPRDDDGDIEFSATVRAEVLRFESVPVTEVRFFGSPRIESSSGSGRTNLPDRVEADVEYRGVRIDYRLWAALRADEMLGTEL